MKKRYGATEISFFVAELILVIIAWCSSWYAGVAVILAILIQSAWVDVLAKYEKRLEEPAPIEFDKVEFVGIELHDHFEERLDFYAKRHPMLLVRQLGSLALKYKQLLLTELEKNEPN